MSPSKKFCLKLGILVLVTICFMSELIAPGIISKNPRIVGISFCAGLLWMFIFGFIISRCMWNTIEEKPFEDLFGKMENPEEQYNRREK